MNADNFNILLRNNTGNKDKSSLIKGFVVRTKVFDNIIKEIKSSSINRPEQHFLIIGQRGSGKTTLLYRLMYSIEDDSSLQRLLIPVMFPEEQYNLANLADLWLSIARYLADNREFDGLLREISSIPFHAPHREEQIWDCIEEKLHEQNKGIVVFLENIDAFFKKIGKQGQQRLREVLTTSHVIRLVGAATSHFESVTNYNDPFFSFFKTVQLTGLSREESKTLLLSLAEELGETDDAKRILKKSSSRLEAFRRLTGGNPRIITYLFKIFLENENGNSILDLYKLLDDLTLLYKSELDQLSPQQQKIVDVIARNWDAISTKEIAGHTDIESKQVAAVLKGLQRDQVVETIAANKKNNFYRLKDRFLNIWYLMRFGYRKDRESIIWLVRFYETWCNKTELSERIERHISLLKQGQYDPNAAVDMGNVFLSCDNVSPKQKYNIFTLTKSLLPQEAFSKLKLTEKSLSQTITQLIEDEKYEEAETMLKNVEDHQSHFELSVKLCYAKGDHQTLTSLLEKEYQKEKNAYIACRIGLEYGVYLADIQKAEHYLLEAVKLGYLYAYNILGNIYYYKLNDLQSSQKYLRISIEKGDPSSIFELAEILFQEEKYDESSALFQQAKDKGENKALIYMASIAKKQNKTDEAIKIYRQAIDLGLNEAYSKLAKLYTKQEKPDYEAAKEIISKAIEHNVPNAYHLLGNWYVQQNNFEQAIHILEKGVQQKEASSANLLALIILDSDWTRAKKMFKKAIQWGEINALIPLSDIAFERNKYKDRQFILDIYIKHKSQILYNTFITTGYCKILIWNNQVPEALISLKQASKQLVHILKNSENEPLIQALLTILTTPFLQLIAKGYYKDVEELFSLEEGQFRQYLKPVYYTLMYYLQDKYPDEYLKAGEELREVIGELIKTVEKYRQKY